MADRRDKVISFKQNKFDELVLYVAIRSANDPRFGATKLNKILFFSDFAAYTRLGSPITGADYQKLQFGPAPRELLGAQERLERSRAASQALEESGGFTKKRMVALRQPNLAVFSAAEISIVDQVMEELLPHSATEVSELSHKFAGWRLAEFGESIPYFTASIPATPLALTPEELEYGKKVAARITAACGTS